MTSLRQEIKRTKPFEHLEEEVFLNLQRTAQVLSSALMETFKAYDLTSVQYNVLRILRGAGENGLLCGEISERLVTKDSDITRLLDRLVNRGFVVRESDAADRRAIISRITDDGLKILSQLDEPVLLGVKEQLGNLNHQQLEDFNNLLVLARSGNK